CQVFCTRSGLRATEFGTSEEWLLPLSLARFTGICAGSRGRRRQSEADRRAWEVHLHFRGSQSEGLLFLDWDGTATRGDHPCLNTRRTFCRPNVAHCCVATPFPKRGDPRSIASG